MDLAACCHPLAASSRALCAPAPPACWAHSGLRSRGARRRTLCTRAEAAPPATPQKERPKEVTLPTELPDMAPAQFGFVENAERLNSRAAMVGFVGILLVELFTHKGILQLLGLRVGQGLGFEF